MTTKSTTTKNCLFMLLCRKRNIDDVKENIKKNAVIK